MSNSKYIVDYEFHTVKIEVIDLSLEKFKLAINKKFPELVNRPYKIQQYDGEQEIETYIDVEKAVDEHGSKKIKVVVLPSE